MARLCPSMPYETIAEPGCNMAFHEHVAYTVGMSLGFPLSLGVSLVCMVHTLSPQIVYAWGFAALYPTDPMMVTTCSPPYGGRHGGRLPVAAVSEPYGMGVSRV